MHLNNVTVAEVEANGRLLVNKAADYLSEIEAWKKHTTFNATIQESSSRQVRYFLYRKCTRRGGVSLLLTRLVIPIAHKIQRWHGSCSCHGFRRACLGGKWAMR